eukprot:8387812-Ditylum_brightwellii.AAC.1
MEPPPWSRVSTVRQTQAKHSPIKPHQFTCNGVREGSACCPSDSKKAAIDAEKTQPLLFVMCVKF